MKLRFKIKMNTMCILESYSILCTEPQLMRPHLSKHLSDQKLNLICWVVDWIWRLCNIKLSVVRNIYARILVDRVRRVTGGLIDDEQGALEQGGVCRSDIH